MKRVHWWVAAGLGVLAIAGVEPNLVGAQLPVLDYNARANYGGDTLRSGFTPDPWGFPLSAGGGRDAIDVSTLGLSDSESHPQCSRSFVTRFPDFHFTFQAGSTF